MTTNEMYYYLFAVIFPIMTGSSFSVNAAIWFFGDKRDLAKSIFFMGLIGGISGYVIALLYFSVSRNTQVLELFNLSIIGFLIGYGYLVTIETLFKPHVKWCRKSRRNQ